MPRRITYHPPRREDIEQFVQQVCERLAERDVAYRAPEVMMGLSRFLQVASGIMANHLNEKNEKDAIPLAKKKE